MIPENGNLKNDDKEINWKSNGANEGGASPRRSHSSKSLKGPSILKGPTKMELMFQKEVTLSRDQFYPKIPFYIHFLFIYSMRE